MPAIYRFFNGEGCGSKDTYIDVMIMQLVGASAKTLPTSPVYVKLQLPEGRRWHWTPWKRASHQHIIGLAAAFSPRIPLTGEAGSSTADSGTAMTAGSSVQCSQLGT